jgi:transposase
MSVVVIKVAVSFGKTPVVTAVVLSKIAVAASGLSYVTLRKITATHVRPWRTALLARRPTKVAAIALANKLARMAWALMARGERYKEPVSLAA